MKSQSLDLLACPACLNALSLQEDENNPAAEQLQ
jgi:uncharacterized protein YbaR (Trm112 family)